MKADSSIFNSANALFVGMNKVKFSSTEIILSNPQQIRAATQQDTCGNECPKSLIVGEKLKYRDYLTVVLIVKKKDLFPDNWIYIHDSSVKVGRIQNYRSWSPELVPDPELSSLGLEYFCFVSATL